MNKSEEIQLLKKCFCEFFNKLLPTIKDPLILTRQRWSQFRTVLLDELKNTQDLYQYVQNLSFQPEILSFKTDTQVEHRRVPSGQLQNQVVSNQPKQLTNTTTANNINETVQTKTITTTYAYSTQTNLPQQQTTQLEEINKEIPKLGKDVFFKRPSTRKLSIKTKDMKQPESSYKPIDEIQKVNVYGQKADHLSSFSNTKKNIFFDKNVLMTEITDGLAQMRKHTTTLNAVYSRSFEISTADKEQPGTEQLTSIQQGIRAQQDLLQLQNAQRNATLKGYSIYAKKDKDVAKQKMDEIAQINDKKKLYF